MKKHTTDRRPAPGYSIVEMVTVLAIITATGSVALPNLIAFHRESALLGAAQAFRGDFMLTRSIAIMRNTQTAIRFEKDAEGRDVYSTYSDGNFNGVQSVDIAAGIDQKLSGPHVLGAGQSGVEVGVLPDAPAPDGGPLGPEPIRFGTSRMVSFSPLGTGTPGTFYLKTRNSMAGVRVTGGSARVRIMILRGTRWIDRS
jgi:hypothetical protein